MPFSFLVLIEAQYAPTSPSAMALAATPTRIDSLTVTNTDTVPRNVSINLVPSGVSPSAANATTVDQCILPGQTWVSPNEVGKVLGVSDAISVTASIANKLVISCSGTASF